MIFVDRGAQKNLQIEICVTYYEFLFDFPGKIQASSDLCLIYQ